MNILVTVDDNYVRPLLVMLDSLFHYNEGKRIVLYLFYSNIEERNLALIARKVNRKKGRIIVKQITGEMFDACPVFRYFPKEMYYRLLCGMYMPKREKRVLYLDPDMLIGHSLDKLYRVNMKGHAIAAVSDNTVNHLMPECKQKIGMSLDDDYVNSGVILFDLEKMREQFKIEEFIHLMEQKQDSLSFPDQDLINLYFKENILYLPRTFNYNCGYGSPKGMVRYFFSKKEKEKRPAIIHFMGQSKPWMPDYYGKFGERYYQYLKPYLRKEEKRIFRHRYYYKMRALLKTFLRVTKEMGDKK